MATGQKLFTTYRAAVDSFPLGEQKVGLLRPGRFNGYDQITSVGGSLTVKIKHSGQRIRKTTSTGAAENEFGAVLMPTGIIIHEFKELIFNIAKLSETSGGIDEPRQDVLICEHNYSEIPGGTPATYFILQGVVGDPVEALPNPTRQVVIGTFRVYGETFSSLTYTPMPAPLIGDMTPEILYSELEEQIREAIEAYNYSGGPSFTTQSIITQDTTIGTPQLRGGRVFVKPGGDTVVVTVPITTGLLETRITQIGPGAVRIAFADTGATIITSNIGNINNYYLAGPGATVAVVKIVGETTPTYYIEGDVGNKP